MADTPTAEPADVAVILAPDGTTTPIAPPEHAEPEPGTERNTEMNGIVLATCLHCGELIWAADGYWDWEHADTEVEECAPE